jgi:hypothetical protein
MILAKFLCIDNDIPELIKECDVPVVSYPLNVYIL